MKEYLSTIFIEQTRLAMECAGWLDCEINEAFANVVPVSIGEGYMEAHIALQHADAGRWPAYHLWRERAHQKTIRMIETKAQEVKEDTQGLIRLMFVALRRELGLPENSVDLPF